MLDLKETARKLQKQINRIDEIQKWTKESIMRRPFCLTISKAWTPKPYTFPLETIYTKLEWVRRNRLPSGTKREIIPDVIDLLDEKQLGTSGSVRVLVTGEFSH